MAHAVQPLLQMRLWPPGLSRGLSMSRDRRGRWQTSRVCGGPDSGVAASSLMKFALMPLATTSEPLTGASRRVRARPTQSCFTRTESNPFSLRLINERL
jgi:hypothetical protein